MKDELFDAVHRGELTPDEAERKALSAGLGVLRDIPDPQQFDPEREAWWTLPMVMAWIVWRTIDRVRGQYDPYRIASYYWVYQPISGHGTADERGGHWLKQQEQASAMDLSLIEAFGLFDEGDKERREATVREAREDLWNKASIGEVQCIAVRLSDQEVVAVPEIEWSYLDLHQNHGRDELCFQHSSTPRYRAVKFRKSEVLQIWKAAKASVRARRDAQERCKQWLIREMSLHRESQTMSKAEAAKFARTRFGIARDPFRAIWTAAIKQADARTWALGGRRPDKQAEKNRRTK
ncbi:MAG: hypothetical protein HOP09_06500 [Hyphomicrobium sp.]|nr:hypothetical protein [Hyphomicrobium sp.]